MTEFLEQLQQNYPSIFKYELIATTYDDHEIWLVKISDNVNYKDPIEPDVLFTGGMHGDEVPGYQNLIYSIIITGLSGSFNLTRSPRSYPLAILLIS